MKIRGALAQEILLKNARLVWVRSRIAELTREEQELVTSLNALLDLVGEGKPVRKINIVEAEAEVGEQQREDGESPT